MNLFVIRGPKRCGNHLLINWIYSNYSNYELHNNCYPAKFQSIEEICSVALSSTEECVMFSMEIPQIISKEELDVITSKCKSKYENIYFPFILRDPFNWMSSMLHKNSGPCDEAYIRKEYIKWSSKYWNIWVECFDLWNEDEFKINYNQFIQDVDYRKNLADKMDHAFCPETDNLVINNLWQHQEITMPSSFDTNNVHAKSIQPRDMKVLERYKVINHLFDEFGIPEEVMDRSKLYWNVL